MNSFCAAITVWLDASIEVEMEFACAGLLETKCAVH